MTTPLIEAIARAVEECGPIGCCNIDERNAAEIAQAALTAITEAGYAVVPIEPTEAMLEAARDVPFIAMGNGEYLEPDRIDIYRAMIAATNNGKAE